MTANPADGLDGNYSVTDERFQADGEDVTREMWGETPYRTDRPVTVTAAEQPSTENRLTLTRDGNMVYEDRLLEGTVQETWTEPGRYRLSVQSLDSRKGAAGESVWTVEITGTDGPAVTAALYDAASETPLDAVPAAPFTVRAVLTGTLTDGCRLFLAGYDADGAMRELQVQPLNAGAAPRSAAFTVENADKAVILVKLFLLDQNLTPLSPAAVL